MENLFWAGRFIALGYTLDEIKNAVTKKTTVANSAKGQNFSLFIAFYIVICYHKFAVINK